MSLHTSDVDGAWEKLGMEIKNTHHRRARFYYKGKLILTTKRSHGRGTIDGPVQHFIRQQMKLTQPEFKDLIACLLDRRDYIDILKMKELIQ